MKLMLSLLLCACVGPRLRVDPVKVEPIHITVDVNVHDKDNVNRVPQHPKPSGN